MYHCGKGALLLASGSGFCGLIILGPSGWLTLKLQTKRERWKEGKREFNLAFLKVWTTLVCIMLLDGREMLLLRLHDMSRIQLPIFHNTMTRASYLKHVMRSISHFFHLVWAFADSYFKNRAVKIEKEGKTRKRETRNLFGRDYVINSHRDGASER